MGDRLEVEWHPDEARGPAIRPDVARLQHEWETSPRWNGVTRPYRAEDVLRLRGSLPIEHTLARHGAERLWQLLQSEPYVAALGALTGNQAMQMVRAGLKAIYLSGWQVAADANLAGQMYPDQSLYPANSVPAGGQAHQPDAAAGRPDRALPRAATAGGRTGSPPSWPMPRPASAGRSTVSS